MKPIHDKIKELKRHATPINYRGMYVDAGGNLEAAPDMKVTEKDNVIEGYCCVWGVKDDRGTVWIKGAFSKSINDRGPKSESKAKIVGVWQHKLCDPIGRIVELIEDDYGLRFKLELDDDPAIPSAVRTRIQVRSGTINQFSFGFDYVWDKMEYDTALDAILVYEAQLFEISPVTLASMEETYAIRSKENWNDEIELHKIEVDEFIKSIPREKQLELRQLLTHQISLYRNEPLELRQKALTDIKPNEESDKFNISQLLNCF